MSAASDLTTDVNPVIAAQRKHTLVFTAIASIYGLVPLVANLLQQHWWRVGVLGLSEILFVSGLIALLRHPGRKLGSWLGLIGLCGIMLPAAFSNGGIEDARSTLAGITLLVVGLAAFGIDFALPVLVMSALMILSLLGLDLLGYLDAMAVNETSPTIFWTVISAELTIIFFSVVMVLRMQRLQLRVMRDSVDASQRAETSLEKRADGQGRMFGIISHELRTPAAAIDMMTRDLTLPDEERREMQALSSHLLSVIDDLRVAVNPDEAINIHVAPVLVNDLVQQVERQIVPLFSQGGISLAIENQCEVDAPCLVDAYRLRSVVTNLLRNAFNHSQGSRVWLGVSAVVVDNARVELLFRVEDNGVGIPDEDVARMFEPFQRGQTRAGGTGAGLYIVKSWIERMGGSVDYRRSEQGGACFEIRLSADILQEAEATDDGPVDDRARVERTVGGMTVLLVEDDRLLRKLTAKLLQKTFPVNLVQAENGLIALDLLAEQKVDLVLTDYFMPEADGAQLIRTLRRDGNAVPVIALTAATIGAERDELYDAGADYVLPKPLDTDALHQTLLNLIEQGRLRASGLSGDSVMHFEI